MAELTPHPEAHPDVAGYLLGTLEPSEADAFVAHLPRCAVCRRELDALRDLPALLAQTFPPSSALPADVEDRTFAAIEAAVADTAAPSPASPAGTLVKPITHARWTRPIYRRPLIAIAAAIVIAALGAGISASFGHRNPAPLATVQLADATGGPGRGIATIRATPAGLTIDMNVTGLPPSPPGTHYTCWLVGPGDTLSHQNRVSVGSFTVPGSGTAHVHWTTAADLTQYPHLGVTQEPDNGDPLHQGPKVLTST